MDQNYFIGCSCDNLSDPNLQNSLDFNDLWYLETYKTETEYQTFYEKEKMFRNVAVFIMIVHWFFDATSWFTWNWH
jgi:hypothetical protein